jgi:metal-responsive CopG/Arc/MetJ family transcriptional regulator
MKTAISVDGQLLDEADRTAKQMGLSRSGLFCIALRDFLRQLRQTEMLAQLNDVYRDADTSAERRMAGYLKNKLRTTVKDHW